jgi:hypothetical protein
LEMAQKNFHISPRLCGVGILPSTILKGRVGDAKGFCCVELETGIPDCVVSSPVLIALNAA